MKYLLMMALLMGIFSSVGCSPSSSPQHEQMTEQCQQADEIFLTHYRDLQSSISQQHHDLTEEQQVLYHEQLRQVNHHFIQQLKQHLTPKQWIFCDFAQSQQQGLTIENVLDKKNSIQLKGFSWHIATLSKMAFKGKENEFESKAPQYGSLLVASSKQQTLDFYPKTVNDDSLGRIFELKILHNTQPYYALVRDVQYLVCEQCDVTAPLTQQNFLNMFTIQDGKLRILPFENQFQYRQDTLVFSRTNDTDYLDLQANSLIVKSIEIAPNDGHIDAETRYKFDGTQFKHHKFRYLFQ